MWVSSLTTAIRIPDIGHLFGPRKTNRLVIGVCQHVWKAKGLGSPVFSPPARWGLLDFMSAAFRFSSSSLSFSFSFSSSSSASSSASSSLSNCDPRSTVSVPDLNHDHLCAVFHAGPQPRPSMPVFSAGPQPRPSTPSVLCRTSTTTIHAQCSLPDLNHAHPRPVFPAGPQPRPSPPSVPCQTSTTTIHAQCSLPDLNREYPRQVFPAGPHVRRYGTKNVQKKVRKNVRKNVRRYAR